MDIKKSRIIIEKVEIFPVRIPMTITHQLASGSYSSVDRIIVKLYLEGGVIGFGEAAPYMVEETIEGSYFALSNYLIPPLIGQPLPTVGELHETMNRRLKGKGYNSVKAAIEMAVYDALGKLVGIPVCELLGGCFRRRIKVGQAIGIMEIEKTVREAVRIVKERGFQDLKLKIGKDFKADIERIKAVREAVGPSISIRVDVNQGYTRAEAFYTLCAIEEFGISIIEQPLTENDLHGMSVLRTRLKTPIMVDESVRDIGDALRVVLHDAADIINIKVQGVGGMHPSAKIAAIAEAANVLVFIGTMMETGLGTAGGLHFAASLPELFYPTDLRGPELLTDDILHESIHIQDGYAVLPEGAGLGVQVDEEKLEKYRIKI
jgi:muconate/chloromuconate cycloisomerase